MSFESLADVETWLSDDDVFTEVRLDELHSRFEAEQPYLAARLDRVIRRSNDDMATALGYFLALVVWRAFDESFATKIGLVDQTAIESVEQALVLDEEIRGQDPAEAVDSDDVVAMEQPHIVHYLNEHIEAGLEVQATPSGEVIPVSVDAVHAVYRHLLMQVLALSYAVAPPTGANAATTSEIHA